MGRRSRLYWLLKEVEGLMYDASLNIDLLIVEGIHDEKTLRALGYEGVIVRYCDSRLSIHEFAEEVSHKFNGCSVAVLMDFDEEGRELSKRLEVELEARGLKVERYLRRKLIELIKGEGIKTIEGLSFLKKRLYKL